MKDNIAEQLIDLIKVHERSELAERLGIGYNWLSQKASEIKKTGTVTLDPENQKQLIRTIGLLHFREFESVESRLSPAEIESFRSIADDCGVTLEQLAAECLRRFGDLIALTIRERNRIATPPPKPQVVSSRRPSSDEGLIVDAEAGEPDPAR